MTLSEVVANLLVELAALKQEVTQLRAEVNDLSRRTSKKSTPKETK